MTKAPSDHDSKLGKYAEFWVLAALLLAIGVPKLVLTAAGHGTSIDGGFYTDVARHVRDGLGLSTHVSLYHHAYPTFPHDTAVYPLWPLVYGLAARFFPLVETGRWLATLFFLGSLGFAFAWGRALSRRSLFPTILPGFHLGHVLVAVLGFHRELFEFTSLPYTEGLAWFLLMVGLWRSTRILREPGVAGAVELGVWCGLAFLARSQMVVFSGAVALSWAHLVAWDRERRKAWLLAAVAWAGATLVVVAPFAVFVAGVTDANLLHALLRFDAARASDLLSPVPMLADEPSIGSALGTYLEGVKEAFSWKGKYAYRKVFYWFQLAVPLAAAFGLYAVVRPGTRRRAREEIGQGLFRPGSGPVVLAVVLAVVGLVSIHLIHKQYYLAWNFTRRQGVTAGLAFALCLWLLATRRHVVPRFLALFLLIAGISTGYTRVSDLAYKAVESQERPHRPALVKWLRQQERAHGEVVVAMSAQEPQQIAPYTRHVGYHWFHSKTTPRDMKIMVEELGVQFVIVGSRARNWKSIRSRWFEEHFQALGGPISGFYIYAPAGEGHEPIAAPGRRK